MIIIFKALSDQNRLRILAALNKHPELCACQIVDMLQVTGATTSRHLGILIAAGLIKSRKNGRWVYYRLETASDEFQVVMDWMKEEFSKSQEIADCLEALDKIIACKPNSLCNKTDERI